MGIGALVCITYACGWDNDTIAAESKGVPELLDALIGRVAIYPKEYYEFRANRSSKIVEKDPLNLDELDNLIVAYDKLGNYPKSLSYAEMKRKALLARPNKDHEYRYYANLGTIEAHAWVRNKDFNDKTLLEQAIKHLNKCIEVNPDAHFGREIVQVKLLEIMRNAEGPVEYPAKHREPYDYAHINGSGLYAWEDFVEKTGAEKVQKGVIGIMSIGSGPDSPDLLCAIISTLPDGMGIMREVAMRRIDELWKTKPVIADIGYVSKFGHPGNRVLFEKQYAALAENKEQYRAKLSEFIKTKVSQGKHPDVDAHFWDDWKEPEHVNLRSLEPLLNPAQRMQALYLAIPGGLIVVIITYYVIQKRRANR